MNLRSHVFKDCNAGPGEHSGSVVELLTPDRVAARVRGSPASLCCVVEQDTYIPA